jgi:surface polysaccharide O-acyltransferase-like enzyme
MQFEDFFPILFQKYWYFTKYFGMYLFLPVINKGIEGLTRSELRIVVISIIFIFIVLKDILNPKHDIFVLFGGYSVMWFLIYYLTGAYFGKFKIDFKGIKKIFLCIKCVFVFYLSTYLCFYFSNSSLDNSKSHFKMNSIKILRHLFVLRINSVPMILQSISITLLLTQLNYNKYLTKIITFLGPLTFGIYLIHQHPIIKDNIVRRLFIKDSYNLSLYNVIKLVLIRGIKIIVFCFIIDYLRHILFTFLRFRKICIFLENCIYKIF